MHAIINGFYYGVDKLLQIGADVNLFDDIDFAIMLDLQLSKLQYLRLRYGLMLH